MILAQGGSRRLGPPAEKIALERPGCERIAVQSRAAEGRKGNCDRKLQSGGFSTASKRERDEKEKRNSIYFDDGFYFRAGARQPDGCACP